MLARELARCAWLETSLVSGTYTLHARERGVESRRACFVETSDHKIFGYLLGPFVTSQSEAIHVSATIPNWNGTVNAFDFGPVAAETNGVVPPHVLDVDFVQAYAPDGSSDDTFVSRRYNFNESTPNSYAYEWHPGECAPAIPTNRHALRATARLEHDWRPALEWFLRIAVRVTKQPCSPAPRRKIGWEVVPLSQEAGSGFDEGEWEAESGLSYP